MKKARKIKVDSEEWKYFFDTGATDHDGESSPCIILYHLKTKTRHRLHYWMDGTREPGSPYRPMRADDIVTPAQAKKFVRIFKKWGWLEDPDYMRVMRGSKR